MQNFFFWSRFNHSNIENVTESENKMAFSLILS